MGHHKINNLLLLYKSALKTHFFPLEVEHWIDCCVAYLRLCVCVGSDDKDTDWSVFVCGVSRVLLLSLSFTPLLTLLFCIKCFGLPLGVGTLVILTYITFLCGLFHTSSVSLCCSNRSWLCRCWLSYNTFLCGLFQASSVSLCCGNKSGLCRHCQLWGTRSASRWSSSSQGQWLGAFLLLLLLLRTVSSLNALMTDTWSACWVILGVSMIHDAWQWHRLQDPYCAYIIYI